MDKTRLFFKMDVSSLDEAKETNKQTSCATKVDNYLSSNFGRGRKIPPSGISISTRMNNLQHAFKEDFAPTKSLKEGKNLYPIGPPDDEFVTRRYNKMAKLNNDSDDNDTDHAKPIIARSQSSTHINSQFSFKDDTPISKRSSNSYKLDQLKNDNTFINSTSIYSSSLANDSYTGISNALPESKISKNSSISSGTNIGEINFIMLTGLFVGLVVSKALKCIQLYLNWLLKSILQIRNAVLGTNSVWQMLFLGDNHNLQMQYKLILLPFAFIMSIIYGFLYILFGLVQLLLTAAPTTLIKFIQNLHYRSEN